MKGVLRLGLFFVVLATGLLVSGLVGLIFPKWRGLRKFRAALAHFVAPFLLKVLNVRTTTRFVASPPFSSSGMRPGMTVSNHISYLDVLLIAAQVPTIFVTSTEVRDEPFVGTLCRLAGCVFVDRRSPRRLRSEIVEISDLIKEGLHVVVFPEATSTRGDVVRPFRRALFAAVKASGMPLWVGRIRYAEGTRMQASYAENDSFLPHLWRLMYTPLLEAEWSWLGGMGAAELSTTSSSELAAWAQSLVESDFSMLKTPARRGAPA